MSEAKATIQTETLGWYEDEGFMDFSNIALCDGCATERGPVAVCHGEVGETTPAECESCGVPNAAEIVRRDTVTKVKPDLKVVR